ncbi:2-oxoglutarate ferredoxin oxidoreductase subunit beta [Clostridium acetobutylicum]|uniref:2-oxoacid ferredoxin oxidoreductase, beta subunit n=1 Tax=Clostridium acetobutylicum (strain ATCC 824 / DSM 792 / JCM 1419 / IAM 19013 / LMG 5710 / NBRC 13948 / NRRL B-527 / VKM B-1787 / 2291 / W) TaxID=272562 RepID=Q97GB1_CLOAB|nr:MULTISPECIES: 2-oxoacid:ferredoxin oxidoreductase subunit beta [Clostridium]AAK80412.1 2-oxoacid ferredoxin oxidoreductase, beta subunit [Clostridium acetobutylicum ATCC 824]ADZ21509.1 2-oxoglutarate ferredoxin oxidoreductase subunit beta [Clostridium acetobutylicum EA 2018]AEI32355.1 2-oxoglutarate ferredoxin oxidoreductase subunit beta [Clostridium acetobutylicum DSM 1731]AWV79170.1 2-oxoacid:ferredoxin oxidoreductase subunit beta [Clostridium acetobutylicum]KHD38583.1 2-oxoacid ferredoxi
MENCEICTLETAWCQGCGNFNILSSLKESLTELKLNPHQVLIVGGIGQAAKTPQYINTNGFCGLHGRALPPAVGAKIANKDLTVIIDTGDGDAYGEGGNHFIHNIRRNVDITEFVHDNQIYGLTKGQASPTTDIGHVTEVQPYGSNNVPLNPVLLAITLGAGFVARAFSGDKNHLKEIMKQAINYKGYSLVDILQPCVSFNKINTFKWYMDRVYKLDNNYDPSNKIKAMEKAMEWGDKIPIGILYKDENKKEFSENLEFLKKEKPLVYSEIKIDKIKNFLEEFR